MEELKKAEFQVDRWYWECPNKDCQSGNFEENDSLWEDGGPKDCVCTECGEKIRPIIK